MNTASINSRVVLGPLYSALQDPAANQVLSSFVNEGTVRSGVFGRTAAFTNTGSIIPTDPRYTALDVANSAAISFENTGTIGGYPRVVSDLAITADNSGVINGSLDLATGSSNQSGGASDVGVLAQLTNSGTIGSAYGGINVRVESYRGSADVAITNSGTIEASDSGSDAINVIAFGRAGAEFVSTVNIVNSGTIRANGGGDLPSYPGGWTDLAYGIGVDNYSPTQINIVNQAGGVIEATGAYSIAIATGRSGLNLTNAGTIRGTNGTTLADGDRLVGTFGTTVAGAIHTLGDFDDTIINTGEIYGSINLGGGDDRFENRGGIEGDVFLGAGDDTFLQLASAIMAGTVDGGIGTDTIVIDATGGGTVNASSFINFERYSQIGDGAVQYTGAFAFDTINVDQGTVTVAAGERLSTNGPNAVTGGDGDETVNNSGTIAGNVVLGGASDLVVNNGLIEGAVDLGSGDDTFVEGPGSRVTGTINGGAGNDLFTARLAGNRTGIGARTGFERLSVEGSGTLTLTLDQSFTNVALNGTGLDLTMGGFSVGSATGSDLAELLTTDGDIASIALGGGNDLLAIGANLLAGTYDGGAGEDLLQLTGSGPATLSGTATGFEYITLGTGALTITGTLGSADGTLTFGDNADSVTVASGGLLAGLVDLGAGDDSFALASGGAIDGSVNGGAGNDTFTLDLAGDPFSLDGAWLSGFETLEATGNGALTLVGAHAYDLLTTGGDLRILDLSSLTAGQVRLGAGDDLFEIRGLFSGSVDGGTGTNLLLVSGGTAQGPVAFGDIVNFQTLQMTGGYATISGAAAFNDVQLTGGRLVGLAGSTIGAPQILVGQGATFGSAGIVNGSIEVAGTLSPGASVATMTVNGDVTLQSGSTSVFELDGATSDLLAINGALSIADGATLELALAGAVRPGTTYDLITATGGIDGSFSNVVRPDGLFGLLVQDANSISLLGQFLQAPEFSPQVNASVDYANATIAAQSQNSALIEAVPALLTPSGGTSARAFAQLTPEPYAAIMQKGVGDAVMLADTLRGPGFAPTGDGSGGFVFAEALTDGSTLDADRAIGSARADGRASGVISGVGYGSATASIGVFAGYLSGRQDLDTLGTSSESDGFVAGLQARYGAPGGFNATASVAYAQSDIATDRALPTGVGAKGDYTLNSWSGDLSVGYDIALNAGWQLTPALGITYMEVSRDAVTETGGGPFALTVAEDSHTAGFADAGLGLTAFGPTRDEWTAAMALGAVYEATDSLQLYGSASA